MKETWLLQLQNIKKVIDGSLETLQNLVKQSNDLQSVIERIEGEGGVEQKNALAKIKECIDTDVTKLVVRVSDLFTAYNALVDSIFE